MNTSWACVHHRPYLMRLTKHLVKKPIAFRMMKNAVFLGFAQQKPHPCCTLWRATSALSGRENHDATQLDHFLSQSIQLCSVGAHFRWPTHTAFLFLVCCAATFITILLLQFIWNQIIYHMYWLKSTVIMLNKLTIQSQLINLYFYIYCFFICRSVDRYSNTHIICKMYMKCRDWTSWKMKYPWMNHWRVD